MTDNSVFHVGSCIDPVVYLALFVSAFFLSIPMLLIGAWEVYGQKGEVAVIGGKLLILFATWFLTGLSLFLEQGFFVGASLLNGLSFYFVVSVGVDVWMSFVTPIYKMANLSLDRTVRVTWWVRFWSGITFAGGSVPLAVLSRLNDTGFNALLTLALASGLILFSLLIVAIFRQATRLGSVVTLLRNNFDPRSTTYADLGSLLQRLHRIKVLITPIPIAILAVLPFPILALSTTTAPFQWLVLFTTLAAYALLGVTVMVIVCRRRAARKRTMMTHGLVDGPPLVGVPGEGPLRA